MSMNLKIPVNETKFSPDYVAKAWQWKGDMQPGEKLELGLTAACRLIEVKTLVDGYQSDSLALHLPSLKFCTPPPNCFFDSETCHIQTLTELLLPVAIVGEVRPTDHLFRWRKKSHSSHIRPSATSRRHPVSDSHSQARRLIATSSFHHDRTEYQPLTIWAVRG